MTTQPLLVLERATKSFGPVKALVDAEITLFPGEAHALVGENGAGKSTLVKILAGVHQPDSGQLLIDGEPTVFTGPAAAREAGVSIIYQEPTLFPDLTVAENIYIGRQPLRAGRRIDRARDEHRRPRNCSRRLGVRLGSGAAGARAFRCRPADRGDRQGALAQRAGAGDGRADRRADRRSRCGGCSR